jgi:hypothetical protein
MPPMRDGTSVEDTRLGRLKQFDERSRNFAVSSDLPITRGRTWYLNERNDQGQEGACVGFGVGHRLAAAPVQRAHIDNNFSYTLYKAAQKIDPWPGENYSGTSVLAGIQAAQAMGYIDKYDWCFSVDDIMRALSNKGPVVVGTNWLSGMFNTRPSGLLEVNGNVAGGHCYLIRGFAMRPRLRGESGLSPVFRITNSWGPDWGVNGEGFIKIEDYERYLLPEGDAVVPTEKRPS